MQKLHQLTNEVYREDKFIWTILDKEEENEVKEHILIWVTSDN